MKYDGEKTRSFHISLSVPAFRRYKWVDKCQFLHCFDEVEQCSESWFLKKSNRREVAEFLFFL